MLRPNAIYNVDCVEGMSQLTTGSIPCVITSPPYDAIRNFDLLPFEKFQQVAAELWRILTPGGNVAWVVQDQIPKETGGITGTKYRQAIFFQELGFTIHHDLYLVISGHRKRENRYYNQVHLCLCMSKGRPEFIHVMKDRRNKTEGSTKRLFHRDFFGDTRSWKSAELTPRWGYRTNVWEYAAYPGHDKKYIPELSKFPALMQEAMADDLVVAFSRPDWVVLDPFCGAATTCKMALLRGRRYLGFEIDPKYYDLSLRRMELAHELYRKKVDDDLGGAS